MQVERKKEHIVLVQAIAFKDGKVLLGQRDLGEMQDPGKWGIPGGKIETQGDAKDPVENTLCSEYMEEAGISLKKEMAYLCSHTFRRKDEKSVVVLSFTAEWESGDAEPLDGTIDVAWVGEEELEAYELATGVGDLLKLAFAKR